MPVCSALVAGIKKHHAVFSNSEGEVMRRDRLHDTDEHLQSQPQL